MMRFSQRLVGFLRYGLWRWLAKYLFGSGAALAAITTFTFYFTALDTWKDEWPFFYENELFHEWLFLGLLGLSIVIVGGQWLCSSRNQTSLEQTEELLTAFVKMVGSIVSHKINRFRDKAENINSRKFDSITLPGEQIKLIFAESASFLERVYALEEQQLDITIIKKDPGTDWSYYLTLRSWQHSTPTCLANSGSTAYRVINSGQFEFFPSKKRAAKAGAYFNGPRDSSCRGDGSIFCYPVQILCKGQDWQYVVSIVTYVKKFCDPGDDASIKKTEALLREICRRLEIELILRTIKES